VHSVASRSMETPPADPVKLLEHWMAWERGEVPPGKTMSELKTGGLRDILEHLAQAGGSSGT
jgi:hypothetical protein